ncbi:segment polarity protein dishevelled homolog DVL-3-like [Seriola lalandi dorsalis]|uniref:segment polarity protein dishevelled homolog DVL-3-like n=1 Tax=Seriola lalandi dorsalis TaxID=1841481 RepID=UPI000C6F87E9|nr:segment polarity protein dishevelled homolog DVL-3-like [Seriola lalandi dorsalis]
MGETKIIYHLDDQETPYLVKLSVPADKVTLADFKNVLKKPNYKFFFKSMDDDFGVVKEEISDDNAKLPCFNGRVVSWLVSGDGAHTDAGSVADSLEPTPPLERTGGIGDSRPPSYHGKAASGRDSLDNDTETGSMVSQRRERERPRRKHTNDHGGRQNGYSSRGMGRGGAEYDSCSSFMSSELESTSCFDSEDDDATSRFSSSTEQSSSRLMRRHRRRRRKPKASNMDRSSSFSSITDSTMSLNIITVTLNMEKYNFLGISIVGQSNERGDGGIYIGSIMKGGAVAADGRIEPGDMLLQVCVCVCVFPGFDDFHLSIHSDMATVAKAMACPESGLEVRDRMWLKITIANAFIGSDVVDWLFHHVEGFSDRREARKYASNLLKAGYIRHTVNKITFSEQCYYVFGDLCGNMTHLSLHDHDGSSGGASDQDTLPPLPHPGAAPWPMTLPYQFPIPHPYDLPQPFHGGPGAGSAGSQHSGSSGSNCSKNEGRKSGGSGSESEIRSHRAPSERSLAPPSERSVRSSVSHRSANSHSIAYGPGLVYGPPGLPPQPPHLSTAAPGAPPGRELASVPPELTASRQSLRMAVGNAGEFFVDVM